jgi:hypothetical protein
MKKALIIIAVLVVVSIVICFSASFFSRTDVASVRSDTSSSVASTTKSDNPIALMDAKTITEIDEIGLQNFIKKHSSDPHYVDFMFDVFFPQIEYGDGKWIRYGYEIFQERVHAGPAISETVDQPLARALIKNPAEILNLFLGDSSQVFGVDRLCGSTDWNFDDSGNPETDRLVMEELLDQKKAVNTLNDPTLQDLKAECLRRIDYAIGFLSKKTK